MKRRIEEVRTIEDEARRGPITLLALLAYLLLAASFVMSCEFVEPTESDETGPMSQPRHKAVASLDRSSKPLDGGAPARSASNIVDPTSEPQPAARLELLPTPTSESHNVPAPSASDNVDPDSEAQLELFVPDSIDPVSETQLELPVSDATDPSIMTEPVLSISEIIDSKNDSGSVSTQVSDQIVDDPEVVSRFRASWEPAHGEGGWNLRGGLAPATPTPKPGTPVVGPDEPGNGSNVASYLKTIVPPCTGLQRSKVAPCEPRGSNFRIFTLVKYAIIETEVAQTLEENMLERSARHTPHIIVRATYVPGSTLCQPLPYVLPRYREDLIRIETADKLWCHTDIAVNEYMVGRGPEKLSVSTFEASMHDFSLELENFAQPMVIEPVAETFEGREWVLWLSPSWNLLISSWEVVGYWDVQRRSGGKVVAVDEWKWAHKQTPENIALLEYTLDDYRMEVKKAHAVLMKRNSGRVGEGRSLPAIVTDANSEFLRAYLISAGDDDHEGFTPAPPPTVEQVDAVWNAVTRVDDGDTNVTPPAGPGE